MTDNKPKPECDCLWEKIIPDTRCDREEDDD
jgi:hypothetical protein